jgi:hypothetical protein
VRENSTATGGGARFARRLKAAEDVATGFAIGKRGQGLSDSNSASKSTAPALTFVII